MKNAIVYGGSGLVGSYILDLLLEYNIYDKVYAVSRNKLNITHPKLHNLIGSLDQLEIITQGVKAEDVYIALGTTRKKTPELKEYYKIDHDYPVLATKAAKSNGAKTVLLVSAVGANSNSASFYIKMKGETERDVIAVGLDHTLIFRPSIILGPRKESRFLEDLFKKSWFLFQLILSGKLSKFKGIEAKQIAKSMIREARSPEAEIKIFHWREMMV